jgi:elongation factor Ts
MSISAKLVMELRAKTGAGMMDCKKALIDTNGDLQAAIDYLRKKGISKAAKKAARIAAEGLVFISVSNDGKTGAMLELNSETDFVAKNKDFINFGNKLVDLILTNDISTVDELKNLEVDSSKINDQLASLIATIGENMNIRRFKKAASKSFVTTYIHMGGKIGVLLNMEGEVNEENKTKQKILQCILLPWHRILWTEQMFLKTFWKRKKQSLKHNFWNRENPKILLIRS